MGGLNAAGEVTGATTAATPFPLTVTAATFVSVPEFCQHTGFDPAAVRRQLEGRLWPGVRVGTAWRIPRFVLDSVLAGRDPAPPTTPGTTTL